MNNPMRLARFAGIDHCTAKERLIFARRKRSLTRPLTVALVILMLFALSAYAEVITGRYDDSAFIQFRNPSEQVLNFTICFTSERG